MTDVRERLSAVDRLRVPDLWLEVQRRVDERDVVGWEGRVPVRTLRWQRAVTIALALSLATLGTVAAWLAFRPAGVREADESVPSSGLTGDPWRDLQPGLHEFPPPPDSRTGSAVTWTGSQLVIWGGAKDDGAVLFDDGFAFDAHTRSWSQIPEAPLSPRYFATSVWTGREVLIWGGWDGGEGFFGDGAAYDPAARAWRRLPSAPIGERFPFGSVWTGSEMIVWGTGPPQPGMSADGAAYDPSSNSWRRIADAPLALNDGATVWTGEEMIVFGAWLGSGNASATDTAVGAAYDPATDVWRELPPSDLSPQGVAPLWTGRELVVIDWRHGVAAFDPQADRWQGLPRVPLEEANDVPSAAVAAGHILVDSYGRIAALRLRDESWDELMIEADGHVRVPIAVGSGFLLIARPSGERPPPALLWKPVTDPDWKEQFSGKQ